MFYPDQVVPTKIVWQFAKPGAVYLDLPSPFWAYKGIRDVENTNGPGELTDKRYTKLALKDWVSAFDGLHWDGTEADFRGEGIPPPSVLVAGGALPTVPNCAISPCTGWLADLVDFATHFDSFSGCLADLVHFWPDYGGSFGCLADFAFISPTSGFCGFVGGLVTVAQLGGVEGCLAGFVAVPQLGGVEGCLAGYQLATYPADVPGLYPNFCAFVGGLVTVPQLGGVEGCLAGFVAVPQLGGVEGCLAGFVAVPQLGGVEGCLAGYQLATYPADVPGLYPNFCAFVGGLVTVPQLGGVEGCLALTVTSSAPVGVEGFIADYIPVPVFDHVEAWLAGEVVIAPDAAAVGGGSVCGGGLVDANLVGGGGVTSGNDVSGCVNFIGEPFFTAVPEIVFATVRIVAGAFDVEGTYPLEHVAGEAFSWRNAVPFGANYAVITLSTEEGPEEPWFVSWSDSGFNNIGRQTILCSAVPLCWEGVILPLLNEGLEASLVSVFICNHFAELGGLKSGGGLVAVPEIGGGSLDAGGLLRTDLVGGGSLDGGGLVDRHLVGGGFVEGGGLFTTDLVGGGSLDAGGLVDLHLVGGGFVAGGGLLRTDLVGGGIVEGGGLLRTDLVGGGIVEGGGLLRTDQVGGGSLSAGSSVASPFEEQAACSPAMMPDTLLFTLTPLSGVTPSPGTYPLRYKGTGGVQWFYNVQSSPSAVNVFFDCSGGSWRVGCQATATIVRQNVASLSVTDPYTFTAATFGPQGATYTGTWSITVHADQGLIDLNLVGGGSVGGGGLILTDQVGGGSMVSGFQVLNPFNSGLAGNPSLMPRQMYVTVQVVSGTNLTAGTYSLPNNPAGGGIWLATIPGTPVNCICRLLLVGSQWSVRSQVGGSSVTLPVFSVSAAKPFVFSTVTFGPQSTDAGTWSFSVHD